MLAVGASVGRVVAQTQQQLDTCEGKNNPPPDSEISECTTIIQSAKLPGDTLAIIFNNRVNGYRMKREYDSAIADYDELIRLRPNNPSLGLFGRAHAKAGKGK